MGHKVGESREQMALFPGTLEELIPAGHVVRVVDAFVEGVDLKGLGFKRVESAETGRPPYHPGDLLKLYVWGYVNQIRSSRRLERESHRNVEVMWLVERLQPDFKTIARFRAENRGAIVGVCRRFTEFCREQGLVGGEVVAVDGTKFKAVASRKKAYTAKGVKRELARLEEKIGGYLKAMDEADKGDGGHEVEKEKVEAALAALRRRKQRLEGVAEEMAAEGEEQRVEGEGEARLMRRADNSRGVGYNVQTAVDGQYKLIVSHEVTNDCNDHGQLYPMARAARKALAVETLTVVADTGYQNGEQGEQCEQDKIVAVVPRQKRVNPRGDYFDQSRFVYEASTDQYRCPAGEVLRRYKTDNTRKVWLYRTQACGGCELKPQCTRSRWRSIRRGFFEAQVERMHQRAMARPELLRLRACLSEHPFGTLKRMTDQGQFLTRGLEKVRAEMSLSVLSYNLRRVMNILGAEALCARLAACQTA